MSEALVLKYIRADRTSYGGYGPWPKSGPVECPDWRDDRQCGSGFHGWLGGEGDVSVWEHRPDDLGLVLSVNSADIRDLSGKVKFRRGNIVYSGTRPGAADYLLAHGYAGRPVIGALITAGTRGTAIAGDNGQAIAGDNGQATAGTRGTAIAGDNGQATAGDNGTLQLSLWDKAAQRCRIKIGYVGEDGIEANTPYRLDSAGNFVKANP